MIFSPNFVVEGEPGIPQFDNLPATGSKYCEARAIFPVGRVPAAN